MIPISVGFGKHLSKQKRIESVFSLLSSQLTEEGIKNLYPDLYLEYRNRVTMKKNITQYQHMKHLQNIGKLEKHDGYIAHITQNMGMREASRLSIH